MASAAYPNNAKTFQSSRGYTYSYAHFPPASSGTSTIVFLHGFPSSSADWSNQISYLTSLDYGALAIDLLGYGASSKPQSASEYSFKSMSDDIAELVSFVGLQKVHFVAHDFGCAVLARIVTFHSKIAISATFIAVPFNMPGEAFDIDMVKEFTTKLLGFEKFAYMRFLSRDNSWKLLDEHQESMASAMLNGGFYKPGALEAWVSEDKKVPHPTWAPSNWTSPALRAATLGDGYRGPTNWYRLMLSNYGIEEEKVELLKHQNGNIGQSKLQTPIMFIDSAPSENSMPTPPLDQIFASARLEKVSTGGHWIMLESPHEVNHLLEDFLRERNLG